ncbi:hypothetical protein IMCC12053_1919 [Celeribacter marinus]|uniref:Uncharacterized protein n=1 Tax=Celeribacter marinus TaxID=1397108 RepID=A0A0P0AAX8_9RHOB|nr:hypothetical protein IMCC12053_1919 [Celeribacter marinus]
MPFFVVERQIENGRAPRHMRFATPPCYSIILRSFRVVHWRAAR